MKISKIFSRFWKPGQPQVAGHNSFFFGNDKTHVSANDSMKASAFYRGVIYISSQIAKLPWEVKDNDNNVKFNTLSKLLNRSPNNEMSAFTFKSLMVQTAIVKGNAYAEIERNVAGKIIGLWPIDTDYVQPLRTEGSELVYRVTQGDASAPSDVFLTKSEILHFKNFHSRDGIVGLGVKEYAQDTLGIARGADAMANSLFANGGLPSGILSFQGALSNEAAQRVKESWSSAHGGRKVGGVAVLEEGATFSPISFQPDVLQFLESRKFTVLEIARFLGLPPTKLFDGESATYNNIEHANLEVALDTLDSWARNMESEVDMKLLASFPNYRTEMDMKAVFRGDMETRASYIKTMMSIGAMTPNQARVSEGYAPYDGGDRYYIATNNFTPSDRLDEVIDSQLSNEKNSSKEKLDAQEAVSNYLKKKLDA